jgi:hypothetical protein
MEAVTLVDRAAPMRDGAIHQLASLRKNPWPGGQPLHCRLCPFALMNVIGRMGHDAGGARFRLSST